MEKCKGYFINYGIVGRSGRENGERRKRGKR